MATKVVRIFHNGRNQAIRIPREFSLATDAVRVTRRGDEIILSARPRDWSGLLNSGVVASSEFMRGVSWGRS